MSKYTPPCLRVCNRRSYFLWTVCLYEALSELLPQVRKFVVKYKPVRWFLVKVHALILLFYSTGGVIAYISSSMGSSPESRMSSSPMSTSPPASRPLLPSRAVGMVVDMAPPAKRGSGVEKTGRSSGSAKSSITSKIQNTLLLANMLHTPVIFRVLTGAWNSWKLRIQGLEGAWFSYKVLRSASHSICMVL